jgi:hypothetical protein
MAEILRYVVLVWGGLKMIREPNLRAAGQDVVFEFIQTAAGFVIVVKEAVAQLHRSGL